MSTPAHSRLLGILKYSDNNKVIKIRPYLFKPSVNSSVATSKIIPNWHVPKYLGTTKQHKERKKDHG
jgi:hypothetical protein